MMKFGLLVIAIALIGCTNDDMNTLVALDGEWVEITTKADTLTFGQMGDKAAITLKRGNELQTNKISLRWYASSNSAFNDYYFNQTGDQIEIENFYEVGSKGAIQTFRKLR